MNWNYISGFFDADGSVTVVRNGNKGQNKTIQVSFHNNEKVILDTIRDFIFKELEFKGSMSLKPAKKPTHKNSFELKYSYKQGFQVVSNIISEHPKKKHRIRLYGLIQNATLRNGKYSSQEQEHRDKLIAQFFKH